MNVILTPTSSLFEWYSNEQQYKWQWGVKRGWWRLAFEKAFYVGFKGKIYQMTI